MASSVVFKRAANASVVKKLFDGVNNAAALRPFAAAWRSFNAAPEQMTSYDEGGRDRDVQRRPESAVYGRRDLFPGFFSDAFDPFSTRSVGQLMNMMDQLMDPIFSDRRGTAASRRGWDIKEDEKSLSLKMDMPGVDKENVKVTVEGNNTLVIRGKAAAETEEEEESRRRYSGRIALEPELYKVDGIKAEMKNGVLKVVVPKVEEDERANAQEITVE